MAGVYSSQHHRLHPENVLSYVIAEIVQGLWPGKLAVSPLPTTQADVEAIARWAADIVVTLMPFDELQTLERQAIESEITALDIAWRHAPIVDYGVPEATFQAIWPDLRDDLLCRLNTGENVLVHCRGGYGRSGSVAAALLVHGGEAPERAIEMVRISRPGAIETPGQEDWIRQQRQ